MKLNFTSLMYFQKVAELEHLTKAAQALHIAQPALSRTIKGLEEELEVTLFEHHGRNIRLTRDGHILLKYSQSFLKNFEEMQKEFKDSRDLQQMTVKLSILTASKLIPSFLIQFKKCHRETNIEIVNTVDSVSPQVDLTLFASENRVDNDHTINLFRENLVLIFPKSDPHAQLPYVNLKDFEETNFISPPKGFVLRSSLETHCGECGFAPKVVMESDNPETTREFVRAGLGISLVPQMTWFEALRDVAALPVAFPACYRYLNLSWKTDSKLSLSAVLLREYIVDHFWEFVRSTSNSTYPME